MRRKLSERERDVAELLANTGWSNKRLGEHLGITERTVGTHMQKVQLKMHVHSRSEAIVYVWSHAEIIENENEQRAIMIRLG